MWWGGGRCHEFFAGVFYFRMWAAKMVSIVEEVFIVVGGVTLGIMAMLTIGFILFLCITGMKRCCDRDRSEESR